MDNYDNPDHGEGVFRDGGFRLPPGLRIGGPSGPPLHQPKPPSPMARPNPPGVIPGPIGPPLK